jgi:hypothetical protein
VQGRRARRPTFPLRSRRLRAAPRSPRRRPRAAPRSATCAAPTHTSQRVCARASSQRSRDARDAPHRGTGRYEHALCRPLRARADRHCHALRPDHASAAAAIAATAAATAAAAMAAAATAPLRRRPRRPRPRRTRRRPPRRPRRSAAAQPPRFPTPRSHHSAPHARIVLRPLMTGHVLWRSCCCCCCCALVVGGGGCTPHSPVRSAGPAGPALWAPRPIRRWVARERTTRVCEVA